MLEYFTVPVGSGCLVAQTDQFGSNCVASTRNFHERVSANEKFIDKLFFANLCFLFQAHTILCFHVFTIVSELTTVLPELGVLVLWKWRQYPQGHVFGAKTRQVLPAIVTPAIIADAMADETVREQATQIGTRGRRCLLERCRGDASPATELASWCVGVVIGQGATDGQFVTM